MNKIAFIFTLLIVMIVTSVHHDLNLTDKERADYRASIIKAGR